MTKMVETDGKSLKNYKMEMDKNRALKFSVQLVQYLNRSNMKFQACWKKFCWYDASKLPVTKKDPLDSSNLGFSQ